MRVLFAASLHHPQQLMKAIENRVAGEQPPLFPPSMGQHHLELAMRQRGYELDVFYRNLPRGIVDNISRLKAHQHTQHITPRKILNAIANRLPPTLNPSKRAHNARLLSQARHFKPDVVYLVGDNTVIYPETLAEIKAKTGAKIIYASGTSPIVFSHKIERDSARLYDLVLVNDFYHGMQWRELGAPRVEALPISAVNPDFHRPYDLLDDEKAKYACDVAFVGTLVPDNLYSKRVKVLEALRDFNLGIWSVHEVPDSLKPYYKGGALGQEMLRIMCAAKLTVNIHGDFMLYGGNMRSFEAAGVGVCQVADDLPGFQKWFTPGENVVTFSTQAELPQIKQRFLEDEENRNRIAQNAQKHVYAHHTYHHRVEQIKLLIQEITG